ncbi:MAG TPA: TonB-dependent receptor [Chitinophagaceae bacterium]|nr:TonB-dependent receptor [Chitinophagaceae bacterium]HNF29366.1 TonB-dependent receptor [Chitinophagaceae bacterium]HNM34522.1 TonB-dependent receptor [Chitinophagaceae bacterium]HNN30964.1 TonB-dependent receptor [Chitinophagaceae bacterium]
MKLFLSTLIIITLQINSFAQMPGGGRQRQGAQANNGHFYGKFVDSKTNKPIEGVAVQLFANVFDTVSKKKVETNLRTIIAANNGDFSFEGLNTMQTYKIKASVIGYKPFEKSLKFNTKANADGDIASMVDIDLGNIKLDQDPSDLGNVTVVATKQMFEMGIDRKVFNVDKNIVSTGQTATEVMKSIPSVSVDIDGNVQLRNATPEIFIDGRPTTLTLDQIPADIIDRIEIITNPSAKYDASGGNAGIINIILKKNKRTGYNGGISTGIDSRGKINLGGDFNYRENKINFFGSGRFNQRKSISTSYANTNFTGNNPFNVKSNSENDNNGYFAFLRGGLDYFVNNRNTISVSANYNKGQFNSDAIQNVDTTTTSLQATSNRITDSKFTFENFGTQLSYKHNFTKSGHNLSADINYNSSKNSNNSNINSLIYNSNGTPKYPLNQQQGIGDGTNKFFTLQTDYENKLTENSKLELGVRAAIRNYTTNNLQYINYNTNNVGFVLSTAASNRYKFNDQVFAAYSTYSFKYNKFSFQLGLRAESSNYTGNLLTLAGKDSSSFKVNYNLSLFPSAFITYKLSDKEDLQLNYSRRVNRPGFFQLLPTYDFSDPQNPSVGNPALNPEFTNSYEFSYNNNYKRGANFLATAYFKHSNNLVTRYIYKDINRNIQSGQTTNDSLFYTSYINASTSYSYGLELTNKMNITKWWDLTLNLNLYNSVINANIPGQTIDNSIVSWFGKINNNFKIMKGLSVQLSSDFRSKTIIPQGGGRGGRGGGGGGMWGGSPTLAQGYTLPRYFDVDLAIRKDWNWKNGQSGSLTLSMGNIFNVPVKTYTEAIYFTQDTDRLRDRQVLRLNFSYRFGKFDVSLFKRKNSKADQGEGGGDMGGGIGM